MEGGSQGATQQEAEAARALAAAWEFEYRDAHAISLDPRALGIIEPSEARRIGALPFRLGVDGPVFVISEPTEERLAAVRELAGEKASFVVVTPSTLEALLNSRLFNPGQSRAAPPPAAVPQAPPPAATPQAPPPAPAATPPAAPEPPPASIDPPVESATSEPPPPAPAPTAPQRRLVAFSSDDMVSNEPLALLDNLLTHVAAGTGNLAAQVRELSESLETNQRELRETKEQLARAYLEHDRYHAMVETLRDELAKSRAVTDATIARLTEVVGTLELPLPGDEPAATPAETESSSELASSRRIA